MAQVSREPIEETIDPELTIERSLETYLKKGYPRERLNQRLHAIQARKELTVEWDAQGVQKDIEYAILTDEITHAWSGMSTRQYRSPSFFRISLTISIHAPRGGSDRDDKNPVPIGDAISIHAPRGGSDRWPHWKWMGTSRKTHRRWTI